jgi:hypothetical protein
MIMFLAPISLPSIPSLVSSIFSKLKFLWKFLKAEKSECNFIPNKKLPKEMIAKY